MDVWMTNIVKAFGVCSNNNNDDTSNDQEVVTGTPGEETNAEPSNNEPEQEEVIKASTSRTEGASSSMIGGGGASQSTTSNVEKEGGGCHAFLPFSDAFYDPFQQHGGDNDDDEDSKKQRRAYLCGSSHQLSSERPSEEGEDPPQEIGQEVSKEDFVEEKEVVQEGSNEKTDSSSGSSSSSSSRNSSSSSEGSEDSPFYQQPPAAATAAAVTTQSDHTRSTKPPKERISLVRRIGLFARIKNRDRASRYQKSRAAALAKKRRARSRARSKSRSNHDRSLPSRVVIKKQTVPTKPALNDSKHRSRSRLPPRSTPPPSETSQHRLEEHSTSTNSSQPRRRSRSRTTMPNTTTKAVSESSVVNGTEKSKKTRSGLFGRLVRWQNNTNHSSITNTTSNTKKKKKEQPNSKNSLQKASHHERLDKLLCGDASQRIRLEELLRAEDGSQDMVGGGSSEASSLMLNDNPAEFEPPQEDPAAMFENIIAVLPFRSEHDDDDGKDKSSSRGKKKKEEEDGNGSLTNDDMVAEPNNISLPRYENKNKSLARDIVNDQDEPRQREENVVVAARESTVALDANEEYYDPSVQDSTASSAGEVVSCPRSAHNKTQYPSHHSRNVNEVTRNNPTENQKQVIGSMPTGSNHVGYDHDGSVVTNSSKRNIKVAGSNISKTKEQSNHSRYDFEQSVAPSVGNKDTGGSIRSSSQNQSNDNDDSFTTGTPSVVENDDTGSIISQIIARSFSQKASVASKSSKKNKDTASTTMSQNQSRSTHLRHSQNASGHLPSRSNHSKLSQNASVMSKASRTNKDASSVSPSNISRYSQKASVVSKRSSTSRNHHKETPPPVDQSTHSRSNPKANEAGGSTLSKVLGPSSHSQRGHRDETEESVRTDDPSVARNKDTVSITTTGNQREAPPRNSVSRSLHHEAYGYHHQRHQAYGASVASSIDSWRQASPMNLTNHPKPPVGDGRPPLASSAPTYKYYQPWKTLDDSSIVSSVFMTRDRYQVGDE